MQLINVLVATSRRSSLATGAQETADVFTTWVCFSNGELLRWRRRTTIIDFFARNAAVGLTSPVPYNRGKIKPAALNATISRLTQWAVAARRFIMEKQNSASWERSPSPFFLESFTPSRQSDSQPSTQTLTHLGVLPEHHPRAIPHYRPPRDRLEYSQCCYLFSFYVYVFFLR